MKNYKTEGVVLKRINFSETDKIFTIFTRDYGKLKLLAKGIRKTTSRKAPALEPFSLVKLYLHHGKSLDLILEAVTINNFLSIRRDLKKIGLAYQICELVDRLAPENQTNRSLFELLISELQTLTQVPDSSKRQTGDFQLRLLWDLGYLPKDKTLPVNQLDYFLTNVMQGNLKSKQLLTKIETLL